MTTRPDVLIHWTGKDFDGRASEPQDVESVRLRYIERLRSIYRHGLWFNGQNPDVFQGVSGQSIELPTTPIVCFTELRPAHSEAFCQRYGRLGIGIDRQYLLEKGANPVLYVQNASSGIINTNLVPLGHVLRCVSPPLFGTTYAYIKPMSQEAGSTELDFYEEHEWRIVRPGPLTTTAGGTHPLPSEFSHCDAPGGRRPTFRFGYGHVQRIVFPDGTTRDLALDDDELAIQWHRHMPEMQVLSDITGGS